AEAQQMDELEPPLESSDQSEVGIQSLLGQEGHQMDSLVRRVEAIDAARALDRYLWIPVQIEIYDCFRQLEVVSLRQDVGRYQELGFFFALEPRQQSRLSTVGIKGGGRRLPRLAPSTSMDQKHRSAICLRPPGLIAQALPDVLG